MEYNQNQKKEEDPKKILTINNPILRALKAQKARKKRKDKIEE